MIHILSFLRKPTRVKNCKRKKFVFLVRTRIFSYNEKNSRNNEKNSRRHEKLSRTNENISRRNENISRNNEKISRRNEKLSRRNENISRTNEKNSRTNEKLPKRKKGDLFTSVNRSLSLLNRIKLSLQYKAIIIIVRYNKTGRMLCCNLRFPQRALTTKEKYTASSFNLVINEA